MCLKSAHAPLPVGETGEVKRKGSMKGGESPNLHKPMLFMGAEGWGYPSSRQSFTLALRQGQRPLAVCSISAKGIITGWPVQGFHWLGARSAHRTRSDSAVVRFVQASFNSSVYKYSNLPSLILLVRSVRLSSGRSTNAISPRLYVMNDSACRISFQSGATLINQPPIRKIVSMLNRVTSFHAKESQVEGE